MSAYVNLGCYYPSKKSLDHEGKDISFIWKMYQETLMDPLGYNEGYQETPQGSGTGRHGEAPR